MMHDQCSENGMTEFIFYISISISIFMNCAQMARTLLYKYFGTCDRKSDRMWEACMNEVSGE